MSYVSVSDVSADTAEVTRGKLISAISARITYEVEQNAGIATEKQLVRYDTKAKKLDFLTLASATVLNYDFDANYMSHRHGSDMFNIYAISKTWELFRVLAGSKFDLEGNDGATTVGTLLALNIGIANQTRIANAVDDFMRDIRDSETYSSGNVQSSSSLRALESLGIVRKTGREGQCNLWGVANLPAFRTLVESAGYDCLITAELPPVAAVSVPDSPAADVIVTHADEAEDFVSLLDGAEDFEADDVTDNDEAEDHEASLAKRRAMRAQSADALVRETDTAAAE